MHRKLCLLLLSMALCLPALARTGSHHSTSAASKASQTDSSKTVHVRGYTRKDGTYVAPYDRSAPGTRETESTSSPDHMPRPSSTGNVVAPSATSSIVRASSHGKIKRSVAAKDAFKRQQPCPSTGNGSGACPGYVIDHVKPLECGGADAPSNMQWQTIADGKAKDKTERNCRN
jgi:hypothetical protein